MKGIKEMYDEMSEKGKNRTRPATTRLNGDLIRDIARIIAGYTAIETGSDTGTEITAWKDELSRIAEAINEAASDPKPLEDLISEMQTAERVQEEHAAKTAKTRTITNRGLLENRIKMIRTHVEEAKRDRETHEPITVDLTNDYEIIQSGMRTAIKTLREAGTRAAILPYRTIEVLQTKHAVMNALSVASDKEFSESNIEILVLSAPSSQKDKKARHIIKHERTDYCGKKMWIYTEFPPIIVLEKKGATLKTFSLKSAEKA